MANDQIDQLQELVNVIKADQAEQKAEKARNAWTKYVSLSMIFLAVAAAMASQKGAGYSSTTMKQLNEATFFEGAASDQWAFFQSKSLKLTLCEMEVDRLAEAGADAQKVQAYKAKVERYEKERKEISQKATDFEKKRDEARAIAAHASEMGRKIGVASTLFQVAIALGGVCLIVKKRWLWFVSLALGVLAVVQYVYVLSLH
jgi:preprotein translocase subunit SecF